MAFDIKQAVIDEANKQGVDPDFALSLMGVESGGNPNAVSKTGAKGVFQMFPAAVKDVGGDYDAMVNDPSLQVQYGVKYLKQKLNDAGGDYTKALGYYNQGTAGFNKQLKSGKFAPEVTKYINNPAFAPWVQDSQIANIANPVKGLQSNTPSNKFDSAALLTKNIPDQPTQSDISAGQSNPQEQVNQQQNLNTIPTTQLDTINQLEEWRKRQQEQIKNDKNATRNEAIQNAAAAAMGLIFGSHQQKNTTITGDNAGRPGSSSWGTTTNNVLSRLNFNQGA